MQIKTIEKVIREKMTDMKLTSEQKAISVSKLGKDVNSDSQYYYSVDQNDVYNDIEAAIYFKINRAIEDNSLIPFVPEFDL